MSSSPARALLRTSTCSVACWTAALLAAAFASWFYATHGSWALAAVSLCAPALAALAYARPILVPYALFVLIVPMDSLFTIGASGTIARYLGLLSGACILLYNLRRGQFVVPNRAILAIAAFVAYAALSVIWSLDTENGVKTTTTLLQLAALYAIVASSPLEKRDLRVVLGAIVVSGAVAALYGIWTFHGQTPAAAEVVQYGRLSLVVGNNDMDVNMYADSLILPFAIGLWMLMQGRIVLQRAACAAGLCVMCYAIVLTGSRESLIAIGIMAAYVSLRSAYRRYVLPLAAAAAIAIAFVPSVRERFSGALDSGGAGRLDIWKVGWHAFLAHPLLGTGLGSFASAYDRYFLRVYQTYDAGWSRASHDLFVHYGVEGGIVGLLLVAGVWYFQFRQARELSRFPDLHELGIVLTGALMAMLVASLFIDMFESKALWLAFALIAQARAYGIWTARPSADTVSP